MRNCVARSVVVVLLSLAAMACARRSLAQDDHEADHDALRKLRAVAEEAINTNQLDLFKPYLADDFSIVTYTDREFTEFEAFKSRWQQTRNELLAGGTYSTTMNPELSMIVGDVAIARGNSDNVLTTGAGQRYEFPSNWTAVLRKVDGNWKIVRAHSSLSPFDNPMLRAAVKDMMLKVGAIALAVGVIVGAFAMWLIGRRRRTPPAAATAN